MFYHFSQNNSGGRFKPPAKNFIIEIEIPEIDKKYEKDFAITKSKDLGLYFDGYGDCRCCGDRWSDYIEEGSETPEIYGEPLTKYFENTWRYKNDDGIPDVMVVYKNGHIDKYEFDGSLIIDEIKSLEYKK